MGGQGQLKNKIIRIGHMGYITDRDHERLFLGLWQLLHRHEVSGLPKLDQFKELIAQEQMENLTENF
jgi:aspartate aminotransferase-like enzyme